MMSQLAIDCTSNGDFFVAWYDNGEEGAWIGQEAELSDQYIADKLKAAKADRTDAGREDFEFFSVEAAAKAWKAKSPDLIRRNSYGGYVLETKSAAQQFLRDMKAALKAAGAEYKSGVVWPEWALKASAAGWKPPKGWKP